MRGIHNGPGILPTPSVSPGGATGLRRFAGTPARAAPAEERCELCGEKLAAGHAHLVDLRRRSIACACTACALLFTRPAGWSAPTGRPGWSAPTGRQGRYRTVPDRVRHDPGRPLTEAEWAELGVPVGIAFFFINSALGRVVAGYPSPAGVTECELDLAAWDRLAAAHPLLGALAPDVEAILVVRGQPPASEGRAETFLIPIDTCYRLAGALRLNWHGLDGGTEVRQILAAFLADLRQRAREILGVEMAELTFACTRASAERYAATPTLTFRLAITEHTGAAIGAIALRCQIRIEPQRRRYSAAEARRLNDLFGDTSRWADTVKPIQLALVSATVPGFTSRAEADLQVPCTYDLEVASARYLQALDDGTIPLLLLFSGTVFLAPGEGEGMRVEPIPWSAEAAYRMPASVWRDVVDLHFPGSAWLRCSRDTLDALSAFKAARALPTWDATLRELLALFSPGGQAPPETPRRGACAAPRAPCAPQRGAASSAPSAHLAPPAAGTP